MSQHELSNYSPTNQFLEHPRHSTAHAESPAVEDVHSYLQGGQTRFRGTEGGRGSQPYQLVLRKQRQVSTGFYASIQTKLIPLPLTRADKSSSGGFPINITGLALTTENIIVHTLNAPVRTPGPWAGTETQTDVSMPQAARTFQLCFEVSTHILQSRAVTFSGHRDDPGDCSQEPTTLADASSPALHSI